MSRLQISPPMYALENRKLGGYLLAFDDDGLAIIGSREDCLRYHTKPEATRNNPDAARWRVVPIPAGQP